MEPDQRMFSGLTFDDESEAHNFVDLGLRWGT